jgi:hypothetical protein
MGSGGVFSGERSGDRPAVGEEEKFFFAFVWADEKAGRTKREEREDADGRRSGNWLEIGEISKKKVVKKFYIDIWCPVSVG